MMKRSYKILKVIFISVAKIIQSFYSSLCRPVVQLGQANGVHPLKCSSQGGLQYFIVGATLKAGMAEPRKMTPNPKTRNHGKSPQILKHGTININ